MSDCLVDSREVINLPLFSSGKVRDMYRIPEHPDKLLVVATDRISAFDVVMDDGIPGKGNVLTELSLFWFEMFSTFHNHLITADVAEYPQSCQEYAQYLNGRSMLVRKAEVLPLEFIVRERLTDSFWKEYKKTPEIDGKKIVYGFELPARLQENDKIGPLLTPSTKAEQGKHDENIPTEQAIELLGGGDKAKKLFEAAESLCLYVFEGASTYALTKGIIIADSKFELGLIDGKLIIVDEVLTPDSSRFWPAERVVRGVTPPSFDKQFLRDHLATLDWNKQAPAPSVPSNVIDGTERRYQEALKRLKNYSINNC